MAEHRGSLRSATLRRFEDPERSRDPRVRAVVAQLTALDPADLAPAPRAHFRAELRAQLVAVAPRVVAESAETPETQAKDAPDSEDDRRRGWLPRPLAVAVAVLAVVLVLGGGAVWWSQRAVPGDVLYGLKRATESFRLAIASSDTARANDYLDFAGRRVDEAKALVAADLPSAAGVVASPRLSAQTASAVRSSLGSADSDVRSAARLLGAQAVSSRSADPLSQLTAWAPSQLRRLHQLAVMLPQSPLRSRTMASAHLVHQATARASALGKDVGCSCLTGTNSDQLGPVPCSACTSTTGRGHRHHTRPTPATSGSAGKSGGPVISGPPGPGISTAPGPGGSGQPSGGPGSGSGTSVPNPLPSLPLPTVHLPTSPSLSLPSLPSLPLSVHTCGVSAGVPGASLSLGTCTQHP